MFIPRTLADRGSRAVHPGAMGRALAIGGIVALALFLILSANITVGQENLEVGQLAPRDIRAPIAVTFDSESLTDAARDAAEDEVTPITETIKSPADNREDQLRSFDTMARRVELTLERRDEGLLTDDEVVERLATDVVQLGIAQRAEVAEMDVARWAAVAAGGRVAVDTILADPISEEELSATRVEARDLVTTDLEAGERALAGDLAAGFVAATELIDEEATEAQIAQARASVPPVEVSVLAGQSIVREGEPITVEEWEILDALGLTRPAVELGTVVGTALVAILVAGLLVAYLWRFEPEIWHRNRSVLLFFLGLVVTALVMRIAADRALWAFVVPTSATVLLIGILLGSGPGAAMAAGLAVLAGIMNRDALDLAVYVLAGGAASLLVLARAERLNAFVRVFAGLFLTNLVVVTAFSLLGGRDLTGIAQLWAASFGNALLSVVLAIGSFWVLGNLFGIMTVFQLLELANPSNRLLRRLLLETPGTYHHSVMVGNLAERAAETIGADPLLARVAAYYHDIGKMKNPLAFIENQAGAREHPRRPGGRDERADHRRAHPRRHRSGLRARAAGADHRLHPAAPRHRGHDLLPRQGAARGRRQRRARRRGRLPLSGPEAAEPGGGDHHARRRRGGLGPVPGREGPRDHPRHGRPHRRRAGRGRAARRRRADAEEHRPDQGSLRRAAAGHVPLAHQVPRQRACRWSRAERPDSVP